MARHCKSACLGDAGWEVRGSRQGIGRLVGLGSKSKKEDDAGRIEVASVLAVVFAMSGRRQQISQPRRLLLAATKTSARTVASSFCADH